MKIRIAVRMRDGSRRLFIVDAVPDMPIWEMRAITNHEVPGAAAILIEAPKFPSPPELRVA